MIFGSSQGEGNSGKGSFIYGIVSSRFRRAILGSIPSLSLLRTFNISLYGRWTLIPEPAHKKSYLLISNGGLRISSAFFRILNKSHSQPFLSNVLLNLNATFSVLPVYEEYIIKHFLPIFTSDIYFIVLVTCTGN